jgi:hypothetical protein
VLGATYSLAFDIVFGVFVVAIIALTILTVRFVIRRDRSRR